MKCPAPRCTEAFNGPDAWDHRMEHVARHLEKAALGQEQAVLFGGPADPSLMGWATKSDVAIVRPVGQGGWLLNNPLQAASGGRGVGRKRDVTTPAFPSLSTASSVFDSGNSRAVSFSVGELSAAASVKSEIFVDEGDEDAEGEDE
ncbi:hypothetical protein M406DRAFT_358191 [Cryphonectria parasitica EP155]|uniref:C2H2-type domain-containing protein n=1 Tax=Cryphonectria parasitica (strain ATCC 38755 / EP155) TaxID=660469 RepID=A0A9P5CJT9_CRYP1|nr:uncharacterized protein M406DRAFT_358191 [Cryphonectria parasitica EP155]KAF3760472.1 hypothetical protein M406DRAFT_358191 [Cryphonectria parasitica EP155]